MNRVITVLMIFHGLSVVGCSSDKEGASGTAVVPSQEVGVASCLSLVDSEKYDVALRPCLLALQSDPSNERLITAVKAIQASVANSKPTLAVVPTSPSRAADAPTASGQGAPR